MIIDGHAHLILPVEKHLALMESAGVERTLLFSTRVHPERAHDLATLNQELSTFNSILAGKTNDQQSIAQSVDDVIATIRKYPARFIGFANVPLGLTQEETASWIETRVLPAHLRGLGEFTLSAGTVQALEVIFTCAAEYGNLPLWVHTLTPLTLDDIYQLAALARKYPSVPLIFGHMGGIYWRETIALAKELPRTYIDLSGTVTFLGPKIAIHELPQRTLFSSDAPFGDPFIARTIVERVTNDPAIRRRVLGENLADLLHLEQED